MLYLVLPFAVEICRKWSALRIVFKGGGRTPSRRTRESRMVQYPGKLMQNPCSFCGDKLKTYEICLVPNIHDFPESIKLPLNSSSLLGSEFLSLCFTSLLEKIKRSSESNILPLACLLSSALLFFFCFPLSSFTTLLLASSPASSSKDERGYGFGVSLSGLES